MNITAILIDDERKALAILKNKIERLCPNVNIIGETQNPREGIKMIDELKPQLVFLDIAMPMVSGFDVLSEFKEPNFEVIFVTAFDEFAIEAISHCAIGYLVKPVENENLISAVHNAVDHIEAKTSLKKNAVLIDNLKISSLQGKKVIIPVSDGLEFIKINEIIYCQGTEGYTNIHIKNRKPILSSYNIGYYAKILQNQEFYLVHKSYLINLNYIDKYLKDGTVILGEHHIPVSRNRRNDFLQNFKK